VNKAISQEDAMTKAQKDKKRQAGFTTAGGSCKKFRFVKKGAQGPPQSSSTGHWRVTRSQNKPSGNFQYCMAQQQPYKPSALPVNNNNLLKTVAAIIVGNRNTISVSAQTQAKKAR
jgi:hypothetical protein